MFTERQRILLLGKLAIQQDEVVLTRFRTQKTGALLGYLACYLSFAHTREELVERFWPDQPVEAGRLNLRVALNALRRQLEPPGIPAGSVLLADRLQINLNIEAIQTDLHAFETALQQAGLTAETERKRALLAQARALYRGELLSGYYEDWLFPERERLSLLHFQALREEASLSEQAGDLAEALERTLQAIALDALHEEAHLDAIRLYAQTGHTQQARQQYAAWERLLRDELGATPSPAMQELARALIVPAASPRAVVLAPLRKEERKPLPALPTSRQTRLPALLTRFFGRIEERESLLALLSEPETRLITLTGAGGSGKTRLAIETARAFAETFPGDVVFVPLMDVTEGKPILEAVRAAFSLPNRPETTALQQLKIALAEKATLLVLDNCEHLIETGAVAVEELTNALPLLKVLVTSRQYLGLAGEREFHVHPLPTPNSPGTPERLLEFASVQLFVDRARAVKPDFQLTPGNVEAVAALCRRLEGIPLALELAAGWARTLPPRQMAARMEQGFEWLVSRHRNVPLRHKSLWAATEWSYLLLAPKLQRFFTRLSVFRGGWTAESAEAVCEEPDALLFLAELQERSLVEGGADEDAARFFMLETLREFGQERMTPEEREALCRRHADHFHALAAAVAAGMKTSAHPFWVTRQEQEHENALAALTWYAQQGDLENRFQMAAALSRFWQHSERWPEAQQWLDPARDSALPLTKATRAVALRSLLRFHRILPHLEALKKPLAEEALQTFRELNDPHGLAESLYLLGTIHSSLPPSNAYLQEARTLYEAQGDLLGVAYTWNIQGNNAEHRNDYEEARACWERSLTLFRQLDHPQATIVLANLAGYYEERRDYAAALQMIEEALALSRQEYPGNRTGYRDGNPYLQLSAGRSYRETGDAAQARVRLEQSLENFLTARNDVWVAAVLCEMGVLAFASEDWEVGRDYLARGVEYLRQPQFAQEAALDMYVAILNGCRVLAMERKQWERAARIYGATDAMRDPMRASVYYESYDYHEQWTLLHERLGEARLAVLREEGRAMSREQALQYAFAEAPG